MQLRRQDLSPTQLQYYSQISNDLPSRSLLATEYVPKETGRAFSVKKHEIIRITCSEGPQVCDFNAFAADDPSEYFWSGRTRTLYGSHLKVGQRLWSTEPKMRPMLTFITDTVQKPKLICNATSHDLLYSRCSERRWELRTGKRNMPNCDTNLRNALREVGFSDQYVHDAFNVFMTTGCDEEHRLFYVEPQAKTGDYVELYADMDLIVAISCCPGACNGGVTRGLTISKFSQPRTHDWEVVR